jgi:hypothetical protein
MTMTTIMWSVASILFWIVLVLVMMVTYRKMARPQMSFSSEVNVLFSDVPELEHFIAEGQAIYRTTPDAPWEVKFSILAGGHYLTFPLPRSDIEFVANHPTDTWSSDLANVYVEYDAADNRSKRRRDRIRMVFLIDQPNGVHFSFAIPLRKIRAALESWNHGNPLHGTSWDASIDELIAEFQESTD